MCNLWYFLAVLVGADNTEELRCLEIQRCNEGAKGPPDIVLVAVSNGHEAFQRELYQTLATACVENYDLHRHLNRT